MGPGEERTMSHYPNINDHGLIGDLQTAALVTTDGTLDWFCCPRFDSPSVFASLLDADRGGFFKIAPDRDDYVSKQLYLPDTAILITRFMTPDGVGEVHDFMPVIEGPATDRHRLVRNIRVVRGTMRFAIEIQPRFDYARKSHTLELSTDGAVFRADGLELTMNAIAPEGLSAAEAGITLERDGDGLRWTRTLREGQIGGVVLESNGGTPRRVPPEEAQQLADDTARFWRRWLHLDPGRVVLHLRAAQPRLHRGGRGVRRVAARPCGRVHRRGPAAEDHVPGRRQFRPGRGDSRSLRGLARVAAGPDRQRRRRPAAIGHLRRGDGRRLARGRAGCAGRPRGVAGPDADRRLAVRALGQPGRGHLGDPRRPAGLHLRPVPDLDRARPRHQDGPAPGPPGQRRPVDDHPRPGLRPDHGTRLEPEGGRVHPALRHRGAGLLAADDAAAGVHFSARPTVAVHARGDGPRTGFRQPGLPVQPVRLPGRAGG